MRVANTYRNLPVRHKLRLVIMVTVTVALLCACAAVLAYDRIEARNSMRNDLEVLAEMLGANSTAALSFDDAPVGAEILSTLRAERHIVAAVVFAVGGRRLASYQRSPEPAGALPAMQSDGARFEAGRLILFKTVRLDGSEDRRHLSGIRPRGNWACGSGGSQRSFPRSFLGTWLLAFALATRLQGIILAADRASGARRRRWCRSGRVTQRGR